MRTTRKGMLSSTSSKAFWPEGEQLLVATCGLEPFSLKTLFVGKQVHIVRA